MNRLLTAFIALLALSAAAWGDELTVTLDPTVEVYPSGADTAMCQTYGTAPCVDFSGTLTDNDTDGSLILLQTLTVTFDNSTAQADYFTQDNTFYDDTYPAGPPGLMSGDVNWVPMASPAPIHIPA